MLLYKHRKKRQNTKGSAKLWQKQNYKKNSMLKI